MFKLLFTPKRHILTLQQYNRLADTFLDTLHERVEGALETHKDANKFDTSLAMGVLTINLDKLGTFVVNKQPPNLQIWLSSPISGPKRFDYDESMGKWTYKHDNSKLDDLLERELSGLLNTRIKLH